ncbi:3-dehydroquinate synthase [Adlercreutzia sp. ZJ304]|uniref:3-dehydroquinate synthase n=1 Tax=Adlercreutzia sp. ZJ304 TaxID=2709791 RepID=UPI001F156CC3|nr:3-dehydroquinate synthase [Adlercreutzia sp. ZJ304]
MRPNQVIAEIVKDENMPATRIEVNIADEKPYDVRIGSQVLDNLGDWCCRIPSITQAPQALVITDSNVEPLYLARAKDSLVRAGYKTSDVVIGAGEASKCIDVASEIWEAMAGLGLTRDCFVVALGGGVVGDLAGFVASTFMRGIKVVQVPTTLLSMVDSSVGGKTGINLSAGKNLVGTFCQPSYVCASTDTLHTLPEREWRCGCAEVAKSAAICSDDFFFWLLDQAGAMAARDEAVVTEAIARCVVFKADIVAQDKTESKGVRECLNYGHTLAHAIEKMSGYGVYSHGAAVAEGMRFAMQMASEMLGTSKEFADTQAQLLDELGLVRLGWKANPEEVLNVMKRDKKARGGQVRFVLPLDVGKWKLMDVDDAAIIDALDKWMRE